MTSVAVFALNILDCFPTYIAVLNSQVKHDHAWLQNVFKTVLKLGSVVQYETEIQYQQAAPGHKTTVHWSACSIHCGSIRLINATVFQPLSSVELVATFYNLLVI